MLQISNNVKHIFLFFIRKYYHRNSTIPRLVNSALVCAEWHTTMVEQSQKTE